tara:strand:- start:1888 stop:2091 length:204 start_codon:yes stop_codon:yes gene_type:complete
MERINRKHKEINLVGEQKDLKKLLEEQNHALKKILEELTVIKRILVIFLQKENLKEKLAKDNKGKNE